MNRMVVVLATAGLAAAGLTAAATGAPPSGGSAAGQSAALIGAAPSDRALAYPAAQARAAANVRGAAVPLPAGGTFNGVRWELAGGDVAAGTLDGVLQYNAACQWLRAWRDGRDAALAVRVLQQIPSWTVFRGTESGDYVAQVSAEAGRGGGELTTQMLAECDASHAREVAYAIELGLTPSS
jgi:hypothetical protein